MKKRILSLLLCGALIFSLCFQSALAAENGQTETECICTSLCTAETIEEDCPVCGAENADIALCEGEAGTAHRVAGVPYLDATGSQQSCSNYTVVDTTTTAWNEGWYVAQGDVTISGAVTLEGDVHLILTDGCSLTVNGGISSKVGGALTIYAQSTGDEMGKLTAIGGQTEGLEGLSAGIYVYNGGITINGGAVNATGGTPIPNPNEGTGDVSSGIYAYMSSITVNGGTVNATGIKEIDASIGIYAQNMTVNGGTVTAIGEQPTTLSSMGIQIGETLTINDGTVNATAGRAAIYSNGICSYRSGSCVINGGTVTAISNTASYESCGIFFYNGDITISGGSVTATAGSSEGTSAGIFASSGIEISGGIVKATGGAVTATGDITQITSEGIAVFGGDITISGGSVTATGGAATGDERATSHGIYAFGIYDNGNSEISVCNITITGDAQVTATGGAAVAQSCGIAAQCIFFGAVPEDQGPVGSITITDNAQVNATGGTVTGGKMAFACGIGASGGITVNGGHVIATGGTVTADEMAISYGIHANDCIAINGGHVIAETHATSETHSALGVAPDLPNITYRWRTAETDAFTISVDSAYSYSDTHTYVEITDKGPTYTITFAPNGGVVNPTDAITDFFGRLTNLPTPTRSGRYRFKGWYTAASGGTEITTDTVFSENTTVYAQWTYSGGGSGGGTTRYIVSFDANGGSKVSSKTVTINTTVAEPTAPKKNGYTFDGWYIDKELTTVYDFSAKVTKSFTLYAKWSEKKAEPDKPTQPVEPTEPTTPEWENPFSDVKEDDWFYSHVEYAVKNGLFNGTSDTTFDPDGLFTRAMLVTVLWRAEGKPQVNYAMFFSDVDMNSYYAEAVRWAASERIVEGHSETEFAPDDYITREQIATIMHRYASYKGYDLSAGENTDIHSYTDFESITEYAISPVRYAVGAGLMKGKTETTINPQDNATRAEVAAILQRFFEGNK